MASTTGGLTTLMQTYYDKVFLDRATAMLTFDWVAQKKRLSQNNGKVIAWNRFRPLALATTALSEGTSNPSATDMTADVVSTTVATYGAFTQVTDLFNLTSIDDNLKEHVEVHAQNAAETIDYLIATQLSQSTSTTATGALFANAKAALSAVAVTDVLTGADIRKAVRNLKNYKGQRFENGMYRGIIQPYTSYDLFNDAEWKNSLIYTDPENIKKGIVGRLHGVEFRESNNSTKDAAAGASSADVYHNFIFAKNSVGMVDLAGQSDPKIYVKMSGPQDTSNPLNIFSTIGWKVYFATKNLQTNSQPWCINIKSGGTA